MDYARTSSDLYLETIVCERATVLLSISLGWHKGVDRMCTACGDAELQSVQQVNA